MDVKCVQDFSFLKRGVLSFNGSWEKISPSLSSFLGYSESELLLIKFSHISHPDDLSSFREFIADPDKDHAEFDQRLIHKDGKILWAKVNAVKVRDESGVPARIAIVFTDITEYKNSDEQLEQQLELIQHFLTWHDTVEQSPLPIVISVDKIIKFANQSFLKIYGLEDKEDLVEKKLTDFMDFKSIENGSGLPQQNYGEEKSMVSSQIVINPNGEELSFKAHSVPIKFREKEAVQTILYDVTEFKNRENQIIQSLEEKQVLLKEIHHRVKNNMAVISGLLELQAMKISDDRLRGLLKQSQLRVSSMAMVHEKLYQTENFSDISFDEYIQELVNTIKKTVDISTNKISIEFNLEPIGMNINQAIPTALIINELVVNSYKHAFEDGESGRIGIAIAQNNGQVQVIVDDNGKGLSEDFDIKSQNSLGTNLIKTLANQLNAEMSYHSENGTRFDMSFPKEN